jgi:ABC-type multidrug transport system ATPase subunit
VIKTEGLTKRYGKLTIVEDLALDVRPGDRYGFLGPNGSGKSTTVRMLLGLVFPSDGSIELLGQPVPKQVRKALAQVGAIIEAPAFWPNLSGRRNLRMRDAAGPGGSRRTREARLAEALERVGMKAVDERPVKAYSLGMKQRLGLAAALLRQPDLLILDEPTNGLDPQGILEIRALLRELNEQGTTVFMSSHLLTEIEALCTRVGVISGGRMVVQDDLETLRTPTGEVFIRTADVDQAVGLLGQSVLRREGGDGLFVRSDDPAALNAILVGRGVRISELHVQRRSLEDVFLANTQSSVFS